MDNARRSRFQNELTNFLQQHPCENLTLLPLDEGCDLGEVALRICSELPVRHTRLILLDRLYRRKSVLPSNSSICAKVFCYLSNELIPLGQKCCTEHLSFDSDLCLCLQLLSYFLAKAVANSDVSQCLETILPCITSVLYLNSIDSMIASFTLLVQIFRCEYNGSYIQTILHCLQESPNATVPSTESYISLLRQLLDGEDSQARRLVLIYALLGTLSTEQWTNGFKTASSLPMSLLAQAFSRYTNDNVPHSSMNSAELYFLTKIGQCWSARFNAVSSQLKDFDENQVFGIDFKQHPISDLFRFTLEMKNSPVSVVRHCCLETFENLFRTHLTCCKVCRDSNFSDRCEVVYNILSHTTRSSWLLRGTLNVLTRLVELLLQTTCYSISWLLDCFVAESPAEDAVTQVDSTSSTIVVATRLLSCATDPSLAIYVADLYVLIAKQLFVTDKLQLHSWFKPLITFADKDYETYGASINQYIFPKMASTDLSLLTELIDTINSNTHGVSIPLLFSCYRQILRTKQRGRKHLTLSVTPCYTLLRHILMCHNAQARLDALDYLRTAIQGCKDLNELKELVAVFFAFLQVNLWESQRSVRQQISYVIYVVTKAQFDCAAKFKAKNTSDSTGSPAKPDPLDQLVPLAALLLQGLYPGVPAARMSLSLSGLYNLAMAVNDSIDSAQKANVDVLDLFCRAAQLSLYVGLSNNEKEYTASESVSSTRVDQCTSRLFIGLCSPYEEDREYALQLFISTGLAKRVAPKWISQLWHHSLTIVATSARPDISPLAWQCIRLAINASQTVPDETSISPVDGSDNESSLRLDLTASPRERALTAIHCLLNCVETQVRSAEAVPVEGLLAVAASKPFYAMLSSVRAILSHFSGTNSQSTEHGGQDKSGTVRKAGKHQISRLDVSLEADQLFSPLSGELSIADRLIQLALRISDLLVPILSQAAPEGHLPEVENAGDVVFDSPEDLDPELLSEANEARKFPEYLTVCCWRSVRELSILLGICLPQASGLLSSRNSLATPVPSDLVGHKLSDDQILRISQFFCTQLLCGRHRGALEQCSLGFYCFCSSLLSAEDPKLKRLPFVWLDAILLDLVRECDAKVGEIQEDFVQRAKMLPVSCIRRVGGGYCITRRSAGLPFFIQNILTAIWATPSADRAAICDSVTQLLDFVAETLQGRSSCSSDLIQRCVIALNIARALFRATGLAQATSPFVERATCLALDGMGAVEWSIRNSSGLLYSALVERIFGGNRSREAANRKNCLTSASFFARYPSLTKQLLRIFEETSHSLIAPAVYQTMQYAALFLLTRLLPPHQSSTSSGLVESTFGPFVLRCAASCNIRIRTLAARAVSCLIHADRLPVIAEAYITQLKQLTECQGLPVENKSHCNFIHGLLLQLKRIFSLDSWSVQPNSSRSCLLLRFAQSLNCLADPTITPCPVIRKVFMSIIQSELQLGLDKLHPEPSGLELEVSELHLRLFVSRRISLLRKQPLDGATAGETIMHILRQTASKDCWAIVLREVLLLISEIPHNLNTYLYDLGPEDLSMVYSKSGALDPEFGRRLVQWIDCVELAAVLRDLSITNRTEQIILRYGLVLLTILTPFVFVYTCDHIRSMLQEITSCCEESDLLYSCNSPLIYFLTALSNTNLQQSHELKRSNKNIVCTLNRLAERFTRGSFNRDEFFDDEVRGALVAAAGELFSVPENFAHTGPLRLLQFLLDSLINFARPEIQKLACESCLRFISTTEDGEAQSLTGTPLPYALLPKFVRHVVQHRLLTYKEVIMVVKKLFIRNRTSPDPNSQASEQRVFAHGDPQCLKDIIATFSALTQTPGSLSTFSGEKNNQEYANVQKQIAIGLEQIYGNLMYNTRFVTEPVEVRRQFEQTCLDLFTQNLSTLVSFV